MLRPMLLWIHCSYAYIEFAEPAGAENAVSALNESTFRQRQLSVRCVSVSKRTLFRS